MKCLTRLAAAGGSAALLMSFTATVALVATGRVRIVTTHGVSMNPTYYDGDLVVVVESSSYRTGEIVAYRVPERHLLVLHRLVAAAGRRYTFKGDNNQSVDPWHPTKNDVIGHALFHIPHLGGWLQLVTLPLLLGMLAVSTAGGLELKIRRRRPLMPDASLHRPGAATTIVAGALTVAGLALSTFAWTTPGRAATTTSVPSPRRMQFAYSAKARPSAAYDRTWVRSPDPIFLRQVRKVTMRFIYSGPPGDLALSSRMSTGSGWHTERRLLGRVPVDGHASAWSVDIVPSELNALADAAVTATGIPSPVTQFTLLPVVRTPDGQVFAPRLMFNLTALQLTLPGGRAALTVSRTVPVSGTALADRRISLVGFAIAVSAVRLWSLVLALGGAIGIVASLVFVNRRRHESPEATIRRRCKGRVVRVDRLQPAAGRLVVHLTRLADFVAIAQRSSHPVLRLTTPSCAMFSTQGSGGALYRFCVDHSTKGRRSCPDEKEHPPGD